jgi:excisionase family DNA binding protein
MPTFFTINEIADVLNIKPEAVRMWVRAGKLPAVRFGKFLRVRGEDADKLFTNGIARGSRKGGRM